MLEAAAGGAAVEAGAAPGTLRQKELVDEALGAVDEALAAESRGAPLDIIAASLRNGINALGEITGEVSTADILEVMFSKFCVGK
jgi:tRNA modification GTPase